MHCLELKIPPVVVLAVAAVLMWVGAWAASKFGWRIFACDWNCFELKVGWYAREDSNL
jgi:hypothetical protein